MFITIIKYLVDYCNQLQANRIPTTVIFDSVLSIFDDIFYARQYGVQFLNILAQYLCSPNHSNFFNIDKGLWRRLLDGCKQIYEMSSEDQRNPVVQSMIKILELGSEYSYLPDVIVDYVPFVESLFVATKNQSVLSIVSRLTKIVSGFRSLNWLNSMSF